MSQFGSLHGRGVHVGLEWFDGSRTSDEEERDGLQRGNQLAGNLYPPHFEASTIFVLQVQMAFIAGNQTSPNLARETVGGKFVLTSF